MSFSFDFCWEKIANSSTNVDNNTKPNGIMLLRFTCECVSVMSTVHVHVQYMWVIYVLQFMWVIYVLQSMWVIYVLQFMWVIYVLQFMCPTIHVGDICSVDNTCG